MIILLTFYEGCSFFLGGKTSILNVPQESSLLLMIIYVKVFINLTFPLMIYLNAVPNHKYGGKTPMPLWGKYLQT
jgi:hypothetical protein